MWFIHKKTEQEIRKEKREKLYVKLKKLLVKITKKGTETEREKLLEIVKNKELSLFLRKMAVIQFLELEQITSAEAQDLILELGDEFGPEKESVARKFQEIADQDNLSDAIFSKDSYLVFVGWKESLYRFSQKPPTIARRYFKEVLKKMVAEEKDENVVNLRDSAWEICRQVILEDLSMSDVKYLQTIGDKNLTKKITDEAYKLAAKIQTRFAETKGNNKNIIEIERLITQIQESEREQK